MAKKQEQKYDGKWKGFYNHPLSDAQKESIKSLPSDGDNFHGRIQELADAGYKVSISYSPDKKAYFVTGTGTSRASYNQGWSLTQAHADLAVAVACVWFITCEIYHNENWPVEGDDNPEMNW